MTLDTKTSIDVVAALIKQDDKFFAAQRGYGELKGKWEFPGGKVKAGESKEAALQREIEEELETRVNVGRLVCHVDYEYPSFYLHMDVFVCEVIEGRLLIQEGIHSAESFVDKEELPNLDWCPADKLVVEHVIKGHSF